MISKELSEADQIALAQRQKAETELKTEWGQAFNSKCKLQITLYLKFSHKGL